MRPKRIALDIPRKMDEFLGRMSAESGIDRSNLIRSKIWEWMQQERDRTIAERQIVDSVSKRQKG